jgi:hypothetical protein
MRRAISLLLALAGVAACTPCPVEPPPSFRWPRPAPIVSAPPTPSAGAVRFIVGGDSRMPIPHVEHDDGRNRPSSHCKDAPLTWAFEAAAQARAAAFFYLGDMERSPPADAYFPSELACLQSVPFCPVFGNHEALVLGELPPLNPDSPRRDFVHRFLEKPATPNGGSTATCPIDPRQLAFADQSSRVFYSADLEPNVHFVALDNVSRSGFGSRQLDWLERDLRKAHAENRVILVGMHKALSENPVTKHGMDEDFAYDLNGDERVPPESRKALRLFQENGVALILASHEHGYWEFRQPGSDSGIRTFITGGLGAPLKRCAGPCHAFYHYLVVDIVGRTVDVSVVKIPEK